MALKQVIAVRHDLMMNKGKTAAQVGHAVSQCLIPYPRHPIINKWLGNGMAKVVVRCEDAAHLYRLQEAAIQHGVQYHIVEDSGKTYFKGIPTVTCIAIGPDTVEQVDKVTAGLKLI